MCPSPPTPARLPFGCFAKERCSSPKGRMCTPPLLLPSLWVRSARKGVGEKDAFLCRGGKGGRRL